MQLAYEGKSKRVYVKNSEELVFEFKDEVTAADGAVRATALGKGALCASVSAHFFRVLEESGIETHFLDYDGSRRITARRLDMVPLEVIVRNFSYGSLLKRMPLYRELEPLDPPLIELHYKDDSLHDPLVLPEDVLRTKILSAPELDELVGRSASANRVLVRYFESLGLKLVDVKFEFGFDARRRLVLADEISGDTFRVLDERGRHLDKEVFRKTRRIEDLLEAYRELASRLGLRV